MQNIFGQRKSAIAPWAVGYHQHQHQYLAHGPSSSATFRCANEKLRESAAAAGIGV